MRYKTGADRNQYTLMPEVLDDYISIENPARVMDAYIDAIDMEEAGFKMETAPVGCKRYNPRDMLKLYIYGYYYRIRSSRRLETESHRNIELMWLIKRQTPDHKTIANFRKENAKALKEVFRGFVRFGRKLGLYGEETAAQDGSKFRAVNSLESNYNTEKLDERIQRLEAQISEYLSEMDKNDEKEQDKPKITKEDIASAIEELKARKEKYEGMKAELEESGETQISTTDPDSRRMKMANGGGGVCVNVQTAVDVKNKLIAEYEVTNHCNDKGLLAEMGKSVKQIMGVEEITIVADKGYFVATDIAECIANGITPHVSNEYGSVTMCISETDNSVDEAAWVSGTKAEGSAKTEAKWEHEPRDFNNTGKNVYIRERNLGLCPMGAILYPSSYRPSTGVAVYTNRQACKGCQHRDRCKEYDRELKVKMRKGEFTTAYNDAGLRIKQITYTADKEWLRKRKGIVEHPFGTIKRHMNHDYCLLKGIPKIRGEFALAFLAYNLKRVINILGVPKLMQAIAAMRVSSPVFFFPIILRLGGFGARFPRLGDGSYALF